MALLNDTRFQAMLEMKGTLFKDTRFNDCVERYLLDLAHSPAMDLVAREHGSKVFVTVGLRRDVSLDYAAPEPSVACRNLFGTYSDDFHAELHVAESVPERTLQSILRDRMLGDAPVGAGPPPPINPRDEPACRTLEQYMQLREDCIKGVTRSEEHCWLTVVDRDGTATAVDVLGNRFTKLPWSYRNCFGTPLQANVPKAYAADDIYVKYC